MQDSPGGLKPIPPLPLAVFIYNICNSYKHFIVENFFNIILVYIKKKCIFAL